MNVILILLDSLNRSYISPYGNKVVETKNMEKLAKKGVIFENHFICSAACMPARHELFSGRKNEFLWKFWGAMEPFDRSLPVEAQMLGAVTALVTDHYHYWEPGTGIHGYHENYMYTKLIRGHEYDAASTEPLEDPKDYPNWVKAYLKWRPPEDFNVQYYRNVRHFKDEKDFHGPRVMQAAADWLDRNHSHEKFFLHVESFDPHEPWYIPEPYRSMYGEYNENFTCWPSYQNAKMYKKFMKETTPEELEFIRNQYHGKVTMVDRWLGRIFEKMDEYDLWSNTMVILTTDHGHALAEPDCIVKRFGKSHPLFEDVANIPLIIYHPEIKGNQRISSTFSTIVDIRATILDALGAKKKRKLFVDGKSLLPVLRGEKERIRDYMLYGSYGQGINLTTFDYTYIRGYDIKAELYYYSCDFPKLFSPSTLSLHADLFGYDTSYEMVESMLNSMVLSKMESGHYIPGVKFPQWKIPTPSMFFGGTLTIAEQKRNYLFDRKKDPKFQHNLVKTEEGKEIEKMMIQKLIEVMKKEKAPPEQFKRLRLENI
ncbi:MAG: sulfatase [Promethearchaeota archaeon]